MTFPIAPAPSPPQDALAPGGAVAGYRLLRRVAGTAGTSAWLALAPGEDETLCITVERASEAVERRVAAHGRLSSPHVLALVDVATDTDGRIVLAYERTDWSLATLLSSRSNIALGEAVTILAPLAAGLAAVHAEGLCSGGITAATVLFCPDGRPVLGGLDTLRPAGEDGHDPPPGFRADVRALGALIAAVANAVDEGARAELASVSDWVESQTGAGFDGDSLHSQEQSLLRQVECRLFALAPALPVVLVADRRATGAGAAPRGARRQGPGTAVMGPRHAIGELPVLGRVVTAIEACGVDAWAERVLRGRALAVCFGIVLLIVVLLAGLAAIPDRAAKSAAPAAGAQRTGQSSMPSDAQARASPARAGGEAPDDGTVTAPVDVDYGGPGDDPVAATVRLLGLRSRCLDAGSAACVAGYAEPASALADADAHQFGEARGTQSTLAEVSDSGVELVQSSGDLALMQTTATEERQPVFVLAVRTNTGWRLRDLFEPN
ncbi:hypothetical protein [Mycetocola miduiensis]|uniref:Protein kinase domain-containing protein n=1 Tax=Mycetocola miduiensis TaxID=995034 RepID=A0A1I5CNQ3_9MICO|nr:hypothetical protein [Mycetocola miduiensis]SFN88655.1 hypothetical protein SAMN05216219_2451 [Mycetocola miduiensis]